MVRVVEEVIEEVIKELQLRKLISTEAAKNCSDSLYRAVAT